MSGSVVVLLLVVSLVASGLPAWRASRVDAYIETAQGMLAWPHSGFHTHDGVWASADDKEFTVRLARYCARNPVALGRMEYDEQQSAPDAYL